MFGVKIKYGEIKRAFLLYNKIFTLFFLRCGPHLHTCGQMILITLYQFLEIRRNFLALTLIRSIINDRIDNITTGLSIN